MAPVREVSFELERFRWVADDRLEIEGRWEGLRGRRLVQPVLSLQAGGVAHRLPGLPGGQLGSDPGVRWKATFAWDGDPVDVTDAELEVGRNIVVELPPLHRRRSRPPARAQARVTGEAELLEQEVAHLREQLSALQAGHEHAASAEPADSLPPVEADRDRHEPLRRELEEVRAEHEQLRETHAALQEEHERLRDEHDALDDRHAMLLAQSGGLRGELDEAAEAQVRLTAELRTLRDELDAGRAEREQLAGDAWQLRAERHAREEELERAKAEATAAREEAERLAREANTRAAEPPAGGAERTTAHRTESTRPIRAAAPRPLTQGERAPKRVWAVRVAAIALVALMLFALLIIVSALA